ncbi:MAG: phage tail assembly chaperone [Phycisphaerae bacterium]
MVEAGKTRDRTSGRETGGLLLGRDAILAAEDTTTERLSVPEWGGDVYVRVMTAAERDAWENDLYARQQKGQALKNVRARLAVRVLVDEAGRRLFSDDDAAALGAKSGRALDRIFEAAQRLNGLGPEDVEALEADFAGGRGGGSSTA